MSCISILCLSVAMYAGVPNTHDAVERIDYGQYHNVFQGDEYVSKGTTGNLDIRLNHRSGVFLGASHTSSLETTQDRGFEEWQIGYQHTFSLID